MVSFGPSTQVLAVLGLPGPSATHITSPKEFYDSKQGVVSLRLRETSKSGGRDTRIGLPQKDLQHKGVVL